MRLFRTPAANMLNDKHFELNKYQNFISNRQMFPNAFTLGHSMSNHP